MASSCHGGVVGQHGWEAQGASLSGQSVPSKAGMGAGRPICTLIPAPPLLACSVANPVLHILVRLAQPFRELLNPSSSTCPPEEYPGLLLSPSPKLGFEGATGSTLSLSEPQCLILNVTPLPSVGREGPLASRAAHSWGLGEGEWYGTPTPVSHPFPALGSHKR